MDQAIMQDRDHALEESMEKILELIEEKKYFMVRDEMLKYNEADIAEMFEELLDDDDIFESTMVCYRLLPKAVSVEVFSFLPVDDQLKIVEKINTKELSYIVDQLDFDDKIDILEELPANIVNTILENTPKEERHLINQFLNYPEDCAGSLMTPEYISLNKDMTVAEAMAHIKKEGMDAETIYTCYVKDFGRKLIGIVSLSTLVISDDNVKIRDIMRSDFVYLNVYDDQEEVADEFKKYDHNLKIAAIFSFGANEDLDGKDEHSRDSLERIIDDYGLFITKDSRFTSLWIQRQFTKGASKMQRHCATPAHSSYMCAEEIEIEIEKENKEKGGKVSDVIGPSAYEMVDRAGLRHGHHGELVPWWASPQTDIRSVWSLCGDCWTTPDSIDPKAERQQQQEMNGQDFMMKTAWETLSEDEQSRIQDYGRRI